MSKSIKGTSRVLNKLKWINQDVRLQIKSSIKRNTEQIYADSLDEVPIDTGDLQRSGIPKISSDGFTGTVSYGGKLAPYAPYVEFGTGTGYWADSSLAKYSSQFKGKGIRERNYIAVPFLFPAFFKYKKQFLLDMRKIAKNIGK